MLIFFALIPLPFTHVFPFYFSLFVYFVIMSILFIPFYRKLNIFLSF